MKLKEFTLKNFRGYKNATIHFSDFTTFVGVNDVGKSTIFEALDIFFGNSKIEKEDKNVDCENENIELIAIFDDLPDKIKLEDVDTTFANEYLLNKNGDLEIKQVYSGLGLKMKEYIVANFPTSDSVQKIHTMKITELKRNFSDLIDNIDKRVSSQIRSVALKNAVSENSELKEIDISLNEKGPVKDISYIIHTQLPLYQLFKSDRSNTDGDSEIQDPIKAMIKSTIAENSDIVNKLNEVFKDIDNAVSNTTARTLDMLKQMNPDLAKEMKPKFQTPKWDSVFKFTLDTDSNIPLNKRGSGVRRLILLNFFRAEAKRKIEQAERSEKNGINIIYAFEEPETAQHPKFQKMLMDSFNEMAESNSIQVMITTHSPSIAQIVPISGLNLIKKDNRIVHAIHGEKAITEVVSELGLISNIKIYPDQIKKIVCLEGPSDVSFFNNIYGQLSENPLKNPPIFVFCGGASIVDFLNEEFIEKLNPDSKFVIVDGDVAGKGYMNKLSQLNNPPEVIKLRKSTIELYLPYDDVKNCLEDCQNKNIPTLEDWNNGFKLNKAHKRFLKEKDLYKKVKIDNMQKDDVDELQCIICKIDKPYKKIKK